MKGDDERIIGRLENLCAMLASPNGGERANAAAMATKMLASFGLSWRDLVGRAFPRTMAMAGRELLNLYRELLQWNGLTSWEREFVADLHRKQLVSLSVKQQACMEKIVRKYRQRRDVA